ncbi:OB-fold nucleic acid binding domain [Geoglobus ahangari]|uniref:OB-fold nucleic acid binding domain n=1 Tax=Geoglobus ahangari TaxID=113653 RepID=A0A0F7ID40_9EURY|nr:OB-fold nucleic acid binding domain-containing protein [Geoglobus ahangari]AKG91220.1 OB-fold nucleic acid binding domain [Geoglobus ahangari]
MDFEEKVKEILEHFGGLIDEETARLLAEYSAGRQNPADVRRGFVRISGRVLDRRVFEDKRYCRVEVESEKGRVYVYFWDEAYEVAVRDVFPGMVVEVLANSGESGFHVNSADNVRVELDDSAFTSLSDLKPGGGVCVRGRVSGIEGERVTRDGRRMAALTITDGKTFVPLLLWDDKVELFSTISPGDEVIVLNANVSEFGGRIRIHAGRRSFVDVRRLEI